MQKPFLKQMLPLVLALGVAGLPAAEAADADVDARLEAMQQQIEALQRELQALRHEQAATRAEAESARLAAAAPPEPAPEPAASDADAEAEPDGITLGGAVRFQYSREGYNRGNTRRGGDFDFDIFRLDLHGKMGAVKLDAQWRWFEYMTAIQHAWAAWEFLPGNEVQVGLTRIPFGNQGYNSHSYFFSSNYYLGLEDTHAMGVEYIHDVDPWNLQLAFFKNDGMGGVDGSVSSRTDSYSYNLMGLRGAGEGVYDEPEHAAGTYDTFAARVARSFTAGDDLSVEIGASALRGDIRDASSRLGSYRAGALHADLTWGQLNVQAQTLRYKYDAGGVDRMAMGAYAYFDTIAARASSHTLNVAWHQPLEVGPFTSVDFYNDYSRVNNKSGGLSHTYMNVLGMAWAAGGLYTYVDYVTARNQPFIGGSMGGDGAMEHRLNINFGYYF